MQFDRTTYYHARQYPVVVADCGQGIRHGAASLPASGLLTYPDTPAIRAVRHVISELDQYENVSQSR